MITLVMDTAYQYLVLGLFRDGKLLAAYEEPCFKKQSESIFPELLRLLDENGLKLSDIDECVITDGPGSYTGLRIAMTIAKILGTQSDCRIYTISTMQMYAGREENANVILDARGHRAYTAHLENGRVTEDCILDTDDLPAFLDSHPGTLFGDGELVSRQSAPSHFVKNFYDLRELWNPVENVHSLVPRYYKESGAYRV